MAEEGSESVRQFFCREWAWAKLWACVEQRLAAKTCGALIIGGPGTGKTTFCSELVAPSISHGTNATALHNQLLAYHFCYAHDLSSLNVCTFIESLVKQLSASPLLTGYADKVSSEDVSSSLQSQNLQKCPDEALKKAVLFPLLELDPPENTLLLLVDSIDESYLQALQSAPPHPAPVAFQDLSESAYEGTNSSRNIAELLGNNHHLFPQWLLLTVSARRTSKLVIRQFAGFRRISLDDLRRSHVVRDVQQYILCRLDREPALRHHLSRETAEMLNQLHIKSNGCFLYLEKVLDGVSEGWVTLREIRDIPGTLNGLYLWLCQRLYPRRQFQRVIPLLSIILAARKPITTVVLREAVSTRVPELSDEEWSKCWALLKRVLCPYSRRTLLLFHHSFAEWLIDVKHCTQKYLVPVTQGHAMLAMWYTRRASTLTSCELYDFAFHLARVEIEKPLLPSLLPLWLLYSGVGFSISTEESFLWDVKTLKLLRDAKIEIPNDPVTTLGNAEDEQDDDDEELEIEGEESTVKYEVLNSEDADTELQESKSEKNVPSFVCKSSRDNIVGAHSGLLVDPRLEQINGSFESHSNSLKYEFCTTKSEGAIRSHHSSLNRHSLDRKAFAEHKSKSFSNGQYPDCSQISVSQQSGDGVGSSGNYSSVDGGGKQPVDVTNSSRQKERRRKRNMEDPLYPYLRGGPVDQLDAAGRTLLHTAAYQGDASLVRVLLERGASHSLQDRGGQTPLNLAARHGHTEVVLTLLSFGADPDHGDGDGWTALRSAAWGGHCCVVTSLLQGGAIVDLADGDGRTALRAAAWGGHEDVVSALLAHGATVDLADSEGRTPLIAAAYMGHAEIVEALLASKANVNHCDVDGRTALSVAALCVPASEGHSSVVTILLENGAHVDHQDKDGLTPLLVAAFEGHTEVCELLLEYEADVDHVDKSGRTPLLAAASMGHAAVVERLLFWGCYVDHIDTEGRTVLSIAAAQGSQETVRLLLDRGLDETHRDNAGWTPLHYASFEGHRTVCDLLLEAGARVNEVDNDGKHALVLAAQEGHTAVVATLLDSGASLHHTSHDGRSALRVAALEGHKDVVHLLLCRGADLHYKDADGRSTLYLLALENRLDMASFLLDSGADVESTDLEGRTPLHVTSWQGHVKMVTLLLEHRARVDAEDLEKRTPLQSAAWQGHADIVKILLENGASVDHTCSQGATALSIAAQEGHESCVRVLLEYGANPAHSDRCGRTAIKVALKGGHHQLAQLLEDYVLEQNLQGRPLPKSDLVCIAASSASFGSGSTGETKPCSALLCPGLTASPQHSPESTFDKNRSCTSLGHHSSSKSSGNLTTSTKSSGGPHPVALGVLPDSCEMHGIAALQHHHLQTRPVSVAPSSSVISAMSFTQQLEQCGRGARSRIPLCSARPQQLQSVLTPLDEPSSPIYASPPQSPLSDSAPGPSRRINPVVALLEEEYSIPVHSGASNLCRPPPSASTGAFKIEKLAQQRQMSANPVPPAAGVATSSSGFTFTQDQHMRIILGNYSPEPRPKRNGIITNPGLKAAQSKASHLLRNGLSGRPRSNASRPNGLPLKKETPL